MYRGEENVFLDDHEAMPERCIRYCALFPKDHKIKRKKLIEYLIDDGIIESQESRRVEFQSGHAILARLEHDQRVEVCSYHKGDRQCVKLRGEDRCGVIQTMGRHGTLVEAGLHLKAIPNVEKWTVDLVRVSLMHNVIREIPSTDAFRCPKLTTLLLGNNLELEVIAGGFLEKFQNLKVLDLSMTNIENLPEEVSTLKNLTALLLCGCEQLSCVPSLGNLVSLKKLDLKRTGLEKMPDGVEFLCSLKYLDISKNQIKEISSESLSNLFDLQVLKLNEIGTARPIMVKGADMGSLRKLETLRCNFKNLSDFSEYWNHQRVSNKSLSEYSFLIGDVFWPDEFDINHFSKSRKKIGMFQCCRESEPDNVVVVLPTDVQMLLLEKRHGLKSLDDLPALNSATELTDLFLIECNGVVGLIPSSWFQERRLRNLQFLQLVALEKLTDVVFRSSYSSSPTTSLPTDSTFSQLTRIEILSCDAMKKLFPQSLLSCLRNLETIVVEYCDNMEEIFAKDEEAFASSVKSMEEEDTEGSEDSSGCSSYRQSDVLILRKLKTLVLKGLPNLESISKVVLQCPLVEIELVKCGQIEMFHTIASPSDQTWTYKSCLGVIEVSYAGESSVPMECSDSNY